MGGRGSTETMKASSPSRTTALGSAAAVTPLLPWRSAAALGSPLRPVHTHFWSSRRPSGVGRRNPGRGSCTWVLRGLLQRFEGEGPSFEAVETEEAEALPHTETAIFALVGVHNGMVKRGQGMARLS